MTGVSFPETRFVVSLLDSFEIRCVGLEISDLFSDYRRLLLRFWISSLISSVGIDCDPSRFLKAYGVLAVVFDVGVGVGLDIFLAANLFMSSFIIS